MYLSNELELCHVWSPGHALYFWGTFYSPSTSSWNIQWSLRATDLRSNAGSHATNPWPRLSPALPKKARPHLWWHPRKSLLLEWAPWERLPTWPLSTALPNNLHLPTVSHHSTDCMWSQSSLVFNFALCPAFYILVCLLFDTLPAQLASNSFNKFYLLVHPSPAI